MKYNVHDYLLADLKLPEPCLIELDVSEETVRLRIGPRDYSWRRKEGTLIGAGTLLLTGFGAEMPKQGGSEP